MYRSQSWRTIALDSKNEVGRHKARVFSAALGLKKADSKHLRSALLDAVIRSDARLGLLDRHGQRYQVDFVLEFRGRSAKVRSVWIIDIGSEIPRLITCYVVE
ncbi:MAG: DUF6883 domain-containing protein [Pyrinomonadaceae bacterium]